MPKPIPDGSRKPASSIDSASQKHSQPRDNDKGTELAYLLLAVVVAAFLARLLMG